VTVSRPCSKRRAFFVVGRESKLGVEMRNADAGLCDVRRRQEFLLATD
jgi:hypothetical protein